MRIALICYRIEQGQGSESGSGYGFASHLARLGLDVTLITRRDNAELLRQDPVFAGLEVIGLDVPKKWAFYKRGSRGVIPYYYSWQWLVAKRLEHLHEQNPFDVVHQYNFHTDWAPHFIRCGDARLVWGPICHQPQLPWSYLRGTGPQAILEDLTKGLIKRAFWHLDPALPRAVRRADRILYANHDVAPPFRRQSSKIRIQTFGGSRLDPGDRPAAGPDDPLRLLFVGRLVPIKGAHIALRAMRLHKATGVQSARLEIVGSGPQEDRLHALCEHFGLSDTVSFIPWLDRDGLESRYQAADALLYPSLANQDTVVAEALAAGLPVLGVQGGGTEVMVGDAGLLARRGGARRLLADLAAHIEELALEKLTKPSRLAERAQAARDRAGALSWSGTAEAILQHYVS